MYKVIAYKFQFLIGTVKTRYSVIRKTPPCLFQFLIGTVKTLKSKHTILYWRKFQFLIGTVKTFTIDEDTKNLCKVSIPHRYCKNNSNSLDS